MTEHDQQGGKALKINTRAALVAGVAAATTLGLGGAASAATSPPTIRNHSGWSGYTTAITPASKVYYVDASWQVPALNCSARAHPIIGLASAVGTWIGLGGVGTNANPAAGHLVQAGTLSRCIGYRQTDEAVHQILPPDTAAVALDSKHPVYPGDVMYSTIERTPGSAARYSMELEDVTPANHVRWQWSKTYSVTFTNVPDSADFIVEKPGPYQSDFGSVTFRTPNYLTHPLGTCPGCGPTFLSSGHAFRFVGVTIFGRDLARPGKISTTPATRGTFSVGWLRGF